MIDLQFLSSDNYNKNCNIHNRKKRHKCASKSRGDKAYSVHPVPKSRGDLSLCPPYDRRPWLYSFIHSFILNIYKASSRELLIGAPKSSTAKKSSLKLRK